MELLNTIANNRFWNKHGVSITWAVAGLCLLLALVRVGWVSYSQASIRAENYQPQRVTPLAQPAKKSYRVSDITGAHLFGDPTPKPVVTKAPKTTLNLTLKGILSASDETMARALIANGKKKTELYSVGENIPGAGASVKEIRANEVLLNRNGATESLPLITSKKSGKGSLITYVDETLATTGTASVATVSSGPTAENRAAAAKRFGAANRGSSRRTRATEGKPRKVRKPNFSGLDRALKKMGEL